MGGSHFGEETSRAAVKSVTGFPPLIQSIIVDSRPSKYLGTFRSTMGIPPPIPPKPAKVQKINPKTINKHG